MRSVLKNFKPRGDNFPVQERKALKSLRNMDDVIFLPAHKANYTVVLDTLGCEHGWRLPAERPQLT